MSYEYSVPEASPVPIPFPLAFDARFYLTNDRGGQRKFEIDLYWIDGPAEQKPWVGTYPLDPVLFEAGVPVVNAVWHVDNLVLPGRGRFEFRLMCDFEPHEDGFDKVLAVETILLG